MKRINEWLEAIVKMVPGAMSAVLILHEASSKDPSSTMAYWPDRQNGDPDLMDLSAFAQQQKRAVSSTHDQMICVCHPIELDQHLLGFVGIKVHAEKNNTQSVSSVLEWSVFWLSRLITMPSQESSKTDCYVEPAESKSNHGRLLKRAVWCGVAMMTSLLLWLPVDYSVRLEAQIRGETEFPVVAPFAGFLQEGLVTPGQQVARDQPLAKLDDREFRIARDNLRGGIQEKEQEYRRAMVEGLRSEAQVLKAQLIKAKAELDLAEYKVKSTVLVAQVDGIVIEGDLRYAEGTSVEQGQQLLVIAPESRNKVVIQITESDYRFIKQGQRAQLRLASLPSTVLDITLSSPSPLYTEANNVLVYLVDAKINELTPEVQTQLKPGMEGVARVQVGEVRLGWRLFHHFIDWLKMMVWAYTP